MQDYSLHPLVLGRGFHQDDIRLYFANPMTYRQCGLIVSTINRRNLCRSVQTSSMPRTYRVLGEFGRATDSGWTDGKTLEKSQNLRLKPAQVAKALASIAGSHQKEAFSLSKVLGGDNRDCSETCCNLTCASFSNVRSPSRVSRLMNWLQEAP